MMAITPKVNHTSVCGDDQRVFTILAGQHRVLDPTAVVGDDLTVDFKISVVRELGKP
jgi:hypothetical protein